MRTIRWWLVWLQIYEFVLQLTVYTCTTSVELLMSYPILHHIKTVTGPLMHDVNHMHNVEFNRVKRTT